MSRPLRVEYSGAVYHVTSRGNEKKCIFRSERDRELFIYVLRQTIARFHWLCHGYVLMENHYHLLIETPEPNLSRGMRQLNGVYSQSFNRLHQRVGHLFQGRFNAVVVDKDAYLLQVCRYILLNPVRAGLIDRPENWEWSSCRALAGMADIPDFLTVNWLRVQFGCAPDKSGKAFLDYIFRGMDEEYPHEALVGQVVLGRKKFIRTIAGKVREKTEMKEIPRQQRYSAGTDLDVIFQSGARQGERPETTIYKAYVDGGYTMREIAEYLNVHCTSVSLAIKKHEENMHTIL